MVLLDEPNYKGTSGRIYTENGGKHWLTILDYKKEENGQEKILVADTLGAEWYDMDEFPKGFECVIRVNEIQ